MNDKKVNGTEIKPIIILFLEDEKCTLQLKCFSWNRILCFPFDSVGELLSIFLNRSYYPELITMSNLKSIGIRTQFPPETQLWHTWLDDWDHEKVERIIRDIYQSNSDAVNSLSPNQRFRIYLNYSKDLFVSNYSEQFYSEFTGVMSKSQNTHLSILDLAEEIFENKKISFQQAQYEAACQLAGENDIRLPKGVQYWFSEPNELVLWMLQYIIEKNKHIKRCELCGRYFVPKRGSKKYCSDVCGNKVRRTNSFCGEMEIRELYVSIVSNLSVKSKRAIEGGRTYIVGSEEDEPINPKKVLTKFLSDNEVYRKDLEAKYKVKTQLPSQENEEEYSCVKQAYKDWLEDQRKYATSLRMKRLNLK